MDPQPPTSPQAPIGVFDSGVGGLTLLRAIRARLPDVALVYVADSAYAPYGDKSRDQIVARTNRVARFLVDAGARAITIACNTATVNAVARLREWCPLPVIAMEPAIKPAAGSTRSGVVGVLATRATIESPAVERLCRLYGAGVRIVLQACPGLVEQVEAAEIDTEATRRLIAAYVDPLLSEGADTLVLGCTHYPFLADLIREHAGPSVEIVDPSAAVARELERRLGNPAPTAERGGGGERFFSSADPLRSAAVVSRLWGRTVEVEALPRDYCG